LQGTNATPVGMLNLQTGSTAGLTLQIRYALDLSRSAPSSLTLNLGGKQIFQAPVRAVPDSIHVLNSCDQIGVSLSILGAGQSVSGCVPMVIGIAGTPVYAAGAEDTGLYQVNFTIPPLPAALQLPLCDGANITSNLTVTLAGAASMDAAKLCVQP
jgi:hypothetical protein